MAASEGNLIFQGVKTGKAYNVSIYIPDAVGGEIGFARSGTVGGATTPTSIRFNERVVLAKASIVTGSSGKGFYFTANGALVDGSMLATQIYLSTIATRPAPNIKFEAGTIIGAVNF